LKDFESQPFWYDTEEPSKRFLSAPNQTTTPALVNGLDVWDVVEFEYDKLSGLKQTSNPFRSNEAAHGVYW